MADPETERLKMVFSLETALRDEGFRRMATIRKEEDGKFEIPTKYLRDFRFSSIRLVDQADLDYSLTEPGTVYHLYIKC